MVFQNILNHVYYHSKVGVVEKEVSYAQQGRIYLIKNPVKQKYCEILLQFKRTVLIFFYIFDFFYYQNVKAEISASSMSHNPSDLKKKISYF